MTSSGDASITVEQVAAVFAGELEGFGVDEVLDAEGIDPSVWPDARARVLAAVADDPDEHARYTAALQKAQDHLHCDVRPLFDDVNAWVAFVHAVDTEPFAALAAAHGLVSNDLSRLERHWRKRLSEDASLRERAKELRRSPAPLPPLVVGERKLVPSPFASATTSAAASARARAELAHVHDDGLDLAAAAPHGDDLCDDPVGRRARGCS